MGTLARGQELVDLLEAEGIRSTVDPALAAPPCVLIIPPNLTFDLNCGLTARWQLVAVVPSAQTADRASWEALDTLVDSVNQAMALETADLVAYTLSGRVYPAYLLSFQEAI